MTGEQKAQADAFLDRIEVAVGEFPQRDGPNAVLIAEIIQAVNGLRSLMGVEATH
jgi:hypothetical protein